jgi:hypothetical protein
VREQMNNVYKELIDRANQAMEEIRKDVSYDQGIMTYFDAAIEERRDAFMNKIEGIYEEKAANLDALLLYRPKKWGLFGTNEILDGFEASARLGFENIQDTNQEVKPEHMVAKTKKIRETLDQHYIKSVEKYHEAITSGVFPVVVNSLRQIEKDLLEAIRSKYRPALEIILAQEVEGEFGFKKKGVEDCSRRFRDTIEQIELLGNEMASVVAELRA